MARTFFEQYIFIRTIRVYLDLPSGDPPLLGRGIGGVLEQREPHQRHRRRYRQRSHEAEQGSYDTEVACDKGYVVDEVEK